MKWQVDYVGNESWNRFAECPHPEFAQKIAEMLFKEGKSVRVTPERHVWLGDKSVFWMQPGGNNLQPHPDQDGTKGARVG